MQYLRAMHFVSTEKTKQDSVPVKHTNVRKMGGLLTKPTEDTQVTCQFMSVKPLAWYVGVTPVLSSFCRAQSGVSLLFIQRTTWPVLSFFSLKSGALGLRLFVVLFHHRLGLSITDLHLSSALLSLLCNHAH